MMKKRGSTKVKRSVKRSSNVVAKLAKDTKTTGKNGKHHPATKETAKDKVAPKTYGKQVLKKRIKSGISKLDSVMQGGLKEGSITLVDGGAGSGKTIFALQFLMEGLRAGENCLYITFEEKKEKLYDDMAALDWKFSDYEAKKQLTYLEYSPEQVKTLIEEGGGTIDQLVTKNKISRIVIDSITSFLLLYQDELTKKESALALFDLINKWGCTAVLTSQGVDSRYSTPATSLEFEADNIIILYHFKNKGKRHRALEVLKMRGTFHSNRTMRMEITRKGIGIKPGDVVVQQS
jgi:circadian clock protein KaiC